MEFKEKLKERRACEEAENAKANLSTEVKIVEAASSEAQSEDVSDGNAQSQPEKTDTTEDTPSHLNGELESHVQNEDCAATAQDEVRKSSSLSKKSETESKEINIVNNTEAALVNGECKPVGEAMLVENQTPKN